VLRNNKWASSKNAGVENCRQIKWRSISSQFSPSLCSSKNCHCPQLSNQHCFMLRPWYLNNCGQTENISVPSGQHPILQWLPLTIRIACYQFLNRTPKTVKRLLTDTVKFCNSYHQPPKPPLVVDGIIAYRQPALNAIHVFSCIVLYCYKLLLSRDIHRGQ